MRLASRNREIWWDLDDCGLTTSDMAQGRCGSLEVVRAGRGHPIVLLPGIAGGWRLLAPLARLLAKRAEVILIGLRGDRQVGGPPSGQRPLDHASDVAGVLSDLGLERPTVLGGSFGAAIALEMAIEFPRSVGTLILSGADGKFRPNLASQIALNVLERFPLPSNSPFLNQFFNIFHGRRPEPGPMSEFLVRRSWETDQGVVAARLRGLDGFDLTERLWEIDVPTFVLAGTRDVVIPPGRQRSLASMIPDGHFELIEGAGHVGFLTHRAEMADRIAPLTSGARSAVPTR